MSTHTPSSPLLFVLTTTQLPSRVQRRAPQVDQLKAAEAFIHCEVAEQVTYDSIDLGARACAGDSLALVNIESEIAFTEHDAIEEYFVKSMGIPKSSVAGFIVGLSDQTVPLLHHQLCHQFQHQ